MRTTGLAGLTILTIATTGCYEHTFAVGQGAPVGPVVYDEWHNHWLLGLIGERTIQVEQHCPSGNATIHDEQSFLNGLVSVLTSGIYSPTTVTIRCEGGAGMDLELDEGELMTILQSPDFFHRVQAVTPERLPEVERGHRALVAIHPPSRSRR